MSKIKGKNTKPELQLRKILWKLGLKGYRLHHKLKGKPDIVYPKKKLVIFVDGCFWHKCPICYSAPKNNKKFWEDKINANVKRDKITDQILRDDGWNVLHFWEHEINNQLSDVIKSIKCYL